MTFALGLHCASMPIVERSPCITHSSQSRRRPQDRNQYALQPSDLGMQTKQLPDVLRTWPSAEATFGGDAEI